MDIHQSEALAKGLLSGELSIEQFVGRITAPPTESLAQAQLDLDRIDRCGTAEVVFGEGKTIEALQSIATALQNRGQGVLITRISPEQAHPLVKEFPDADYQSVSRTLRIGATSENVTPPWSTLGRVCIVSAGTCDLPVAEEARVTAAWIGVTVETVYDVGVAGPQRLTENLDTLRRADAVVVVAGMEAALASVVGGHLACPIIAVPTSVGYGAHFGGIAALLSVLNSCAASVSTVNIDAGFKGGYIAGLIAKQMAQLRYQNDKAGSTGNAQ
jgi:NCAIR mutase (PurE)-related protein